jgi:hypothetical protein
VNYEARITLATPAQKDIDFGTTIGTLTFAPGQTSKTVNVPIYGDNTVEVDETFILYISSPTEATIAVAKGTATIRNDDVAGAPPAAPSPSGGSS